MEYISHTENLCSKYTIPPKIFSDIKECIRYKKNLEEPYNSTLSGQISEEYKINIIDRDVVNFLEKGALEFYNENLRKERQIDTHLIDENGNNLNNLNYDIKLDGIWLNKQKKYEYNPIHEHSGVVSFVCWVQIPYNLEDELTFDNCKNANLQTNSLFEFVYTDITGKVATQDLLVDKSWEGTCIFFDSKTLHHVNPFYTSDEYRISISGNFSIKQKKTIDANKKKKIKFY